MNPLIVPQKDSDNNVRFTFLKLIFWLVLRFGVLDAQYPIPCLTFWFGFFRDGV